MTGDALGEEGLFEKSDTGHNPIRKEIATAEEESFVLEITAQSFEKVREDLYRMKL